MSIEAWIDTAFDGHFVFSTPLIEELGLDTLVETEAILADGTKVTLETFLGYMDWFGNVIPVQVVASEGEFPLLGTALLDERCLLINYRERSLELT
jgi:clan AA aspartic protease